MLILGSASEARKELLHTAGLSLAKILVPHINENQKPKELPTVYVKRMALEKSKALDVDKEAFLITADTIVLAGREILHKTFDKKEAKSHLKKLSGRRHSVITSFCIRQDTYSRIETVKTTLKMKNISEKDIEKYLLSNEWKGRAGAYSIQGKALCFFPFISGCFSNVVGLPLPKLINILRVMRYPLQKNVF